MRKLEHHFFFFFLQLYLTSKGCEDLTKTEVWNVITPISPRLGVRNIHFAVFPEGTTLVFPKNTTGNQRPILFQRLGWLVPRRMPNVSMPWICALLGFKVGSFFLEKTWWKQRHKGKREKKLEEIHLKVIKVSCSYKYFLVLFGYSFPRLFWQAKRARLYVSSLGSEFVRDSIGRC